MNISKPNYVILGDDDVDDFSLFRDALKELNINVKLSWAKDGVQLLDFLSLDKTLPDIVFLDLNMPRKNGFDCLKAMKESGRFSNIPVIIYSTSAEQKAIDQLYNEGAHLYIQKPTKFSKLKEIISTAISLIDFKPQKDKFVLKQ